MAVSWQVKSETVHHSKATWVGSKPRDGGFALLKEAFEWIRDNRTPGKLVVNFGTGGSVSDLEFEQREAAVTPEAEEDEVRSSNGFVRMLE
jgi:hypothetical protein